MINRISRRQAIEAAIGFSAVPLLGGAPRAAHAQHTTDQAAPGADNELGHLFGNAARTGQTGREGPLREPKLVWQATLGDSPFAPIMIEDSVLAGSRNGTMFQLDVETGAVQLLMLVDGEISEAPAITKELVVVPGADGMLRAISRSNGRELWAANTGGSRLTSPAIVGETIYVAAIMGSGDGLSDIPNAVFAISMADGGIIWTSDTLIGPNLSNVAVADDSVYVGTMTGGPNLHTLDAETGALRWEYQAPNLAISTPSVAGNTIFYPCGYRIDGAFSALDAETGEELWVVTIGPVPGSTPVVSGELVIVVDANGITAVEIATGAIAWKAETTGYPAPTPVLGGSLLYSSHGYGGQVIHATDVASGEPVWTIPLESQISEPMAIDRGYLLVVTEDGLLSAFS